MIISIQINNQTYEIDGENPLDISIPLNFNGVQPSAYGADKAAAKPCQAGDLVGDTRSGGSCNFEEFTFISHCNGTHTECVGHLTDERISVHDCLKDSFIAATLVTIEPVSVLESEETYAVDLDNADKLITGFALRNALANANRDFLQALVVRTLPNDANKTARDYMKNPPPFFSTEAVKFIAEKRIKHLLVDLPSIDRTFDEGKLSNHRIFWNVAAQSRQISKFTRLNSTITEMIFVPNSISDGCFLLNLQIPSFASDAAPSRPILFRVSI